MDVESRVDTTYRKEEDHTFNEYEWAVVLVLNLHANNSLICTLVKNFFVVSLVVTANQILTDNLPIQPINWCPYIKIWQWSYQQKKMSGYVTEWQRELGL